MMRRLVLIIFILTCLAQWYVPGAMIAEQEDLLRSGKVFRFKTAPIDPSDPFRGKYITLTFDAEMYRQRTKDEWHAGENAIVILGEDDEGFAKVADIVKEFPGDDKDYFEAEVMWDADENIRLKFPFERFYLEESKASAAEQAYWEANRNDSTQVAYAVVRVRNGKTTLEDVKINDRSIVEIVRGMNEGGE